MNPMILVNLKMLRNGNSDEFDEFSKSGGSDDSGESFDTNAYFHLGDPGDFIILENLINVLSLVIVVKTVQYGESGD